MYKDKEKQREANRRAKQRSRQGMTSAGMTSAGMTSAGMTYQLPTLPDDDVLACNADITWSDILALDRAVIDEVYHTSEVMGIPVLLRLKRAAGYRRRAA